MNVPRILSIGNANLDEEFYVDRIPGVDEESEAGHYEAAPGGSASNFAVAVSRLGYEAGFMGCLGNDEAAEVIRRNFEKNGVSMDFVEVLDMPTGRVVVLVERGTGNRAMVAFRGANSRLTEDLVDQGKIEWADHVHVSGTSIGVAAKALSIAKELGRSSSYDPGGIAVKKRRGELRRVLENVDILFVNRVELQSLVEEFGKLTSLLSLVGLLVVKRGEEGSEAIAEGLRASAPAFEVEVLDTTGAGDSFNAGFVSAWLKGFGVEECLLVGNAVAALKIRRRGAQASPRLDEVKSFLDERGFPHVAGKL